MLVFFSLLSCFDNIYQEKNNWIFEGLKYNFLDFKQVKTERMIFIDFFFKLFCFTDFNMSLRKFY